MTPWHEGRRFWACVCGFREETTENEPLDHACERCGSDMREWLPPDVARERAK